MAQVTFKLSELDELIKNSDSGVTLVSNCVRQLVLSPFQLQHFKNSIRSSLYCSVAKYDSQLDGIILSYKRIKIEDFFSIQDDGKSKFRYTADIYVFKPKTGSILTGIVNKKGSDHLGCLVHRVFNIAIPRPDNLSDDESWIGSKLCIGQEVQFKVVDVDLNEDMPYIKGEIVNQTGNCKSVDNYTVEDMEIEEDDGNGGECNKKFGLVFKDILKEEWRSEINNINCKTDDAEYSKNKIEELVLPNDNIYSYAQIFLKECYCKHNTLFSSMAKTKLTQAGSLHYKCISKSSESNFNYKSENLFILFFCDFFNYDFIFNNTNKIPDLKWKEIKSSTQESSVIRNKVDKLDDVKSKHKRKKKKRKKEKRIAVDEVDFPKSNKSLPNDLKSFKQKRKLTKEIKIHDLVLSKESKFLKQKLKTDGNSDNKNVLDSKRIKPNDDDEVVIIKEVNVNNSKKDSKKSSGGLIVDKVIESENIIDNEIEVLYDSAKETSCPNAGILDFYSSFLDSEINFQKLLNKNKIFHKDRKKEEKRKHKSKKKRKNDTVD